MQELTIKIPERVSDNFGEPIRFIVSVLTDVSREQYQKVHFDFNNCKFTSPLILVGLTSIVQMLNAKGIDSYFTFNENNKGFESYLKTVYFPDGFNYGKYPLNTLGSVLEPYHSKSYIPLVCFPAKANALENEIRDKVISAVESIFKMQLGISGDLLEAIFYLISELTQNIVDHSGSAKGILFAQFYKGNNYMDIGIADYGKGLLQSYLDSGKHNPKTDEEALNMAVYGKSTKNIPESRGFGISTSRKMLVQGLGGKFFIMSGKALFIQTQESTEILTMLEGVEYKGCYVALRVPIFDNKKFKFYDYTE